jgi:hypothetical protein
VGVGDHILYVQIYGSEIKLAGEEYLIVREDVVLGVSDGAETPATKETIWQRRRLSTARIPGRQS